jgi:hypothetical protein
MVQEHRVTNHGPSTITLYVDGKVQFLPTGAAYSGPVETIEAGRCKFAVEPIERPAS